MEINNDLILLIIAFITLVNTMVFVPIAKFCFYLIKEISYIKGHLNIED